MLCDKSLGENIIEASGTGSKIKEAMLGAFKRKLMLSGNNITFFKEPFTPISLTGTECSLSCRHCSSHYLRHMLDGSADKLYQIASQLAVEGANGILLSGGSDSNGSVPVDSRAKIIQKIKKDKKLRISAHTGILSRERAEVLSGFLDMALVDVIGDDGTIQDILGLDACVQDYENTLKYLSSSGISIAPHIIVGLNNGKLKGEFKALEIARRFNPAVVVIVVFIPTAGTDMEDIAPPAVEDVVRVIAHARQTFDVPISLSCVRPGGRYRSLLDKYAILSGIDRIAVPSREAYEAARENGLNIIEIPGMCCSYQV